MRNRETETFALENFEGPLDFLHHLIQKNEIDIYDIPLQKIMEQYLIRMNEPDSYDVDSGAEFIGTAASLLWLKSKMLLPKHEQQASGEEEEIDPRFEIIHQLIDYCRFKQAAKELAEREQQQSSHFFRGSTGPFEAKKNLGIEHLTLQDLAVLFNDVLSRSSSQTGLIYEEAWKVSDKISAIRLLLKEIGHIPFGLLFSRERSRDELIVTFLGILELMKLGEVSVVKQLKDGQVMITNKVRDHEERN